MKKILLFVILVMLLSFTSSFAQASKGNFENIRIPRCSPYYLYDIKTGNEYTIDNWGIINVAEATEWDEYWNSKGYRSPGYDGVIESDSIVLTLNITNNTYVPKNYLENVSVKIVYNNQYEITGWWHQLKASYEYVYDLWTYEEQLVYKYLSESDCMKIDPFYQGYYRFGATVPDYIIKDNKPLYLEVTLGDVIMTYFIRK